jgi:DNA-binding MarR family transcriptional regulator
VSTRLASIQAERLANTFAALAVTISDRVQLRIFERFELGPSAAAALVILGRRPQYIESLSRQVALSHSATVRLVDRLEDAGLARRGPGSDARRVGLRLTAAGRRRADAILAERAQVVSELLESLGAADRRALAEVVELLLEELAEDWTEGMHMCRLCDIPFCEQKAPCPVALGAEEHAHG